ncbi:hypothetical protein LJC01_02905 [Clostridiaceae bacterium OttesenSCG-928-D20]|nr:hypothetical protein [Clostridiaceae bacterium OttesenSCG-928-D20]
MTGKDYDDNFIDPKSFSVDDIISDFFLDQDQQETETELIDSSRPLEPEEDGEIYIYSADSSDDYEDEYPEEETLTDEAENTASQDYINEQEYFDSIESSVEKDYEDFDSAEEKYNIDYASGPGETAGAEDFTGKSTGSFESFEAELSDNMDDSYAKSSTSEYTRKFNKTEEEKSGFVHWLSSIFIPIIASVMLRRQSRAERQDKYAKQAEKEVDIPDVSPKRAARIYANQALGLKLRFTIAAVLSGILCYVALAYEKLPLPSILRDNIRIASLFCIILLLLVILAGLDVFVNGIISFVKGKYNAESLISLSCLFSLLDASMMAVRMDSSQGLPYCAISALSLTFAILGSRLFCLGMRNTLKTAARAKSPMIVSAEQNLDEKENVLMKTSGSLKGFTRRSEEADGMEAVYSVLAPVFIILAPFFSILAVIGKDYLQFFHIVSALFAMSASFSALLCFPIPFYFSSKYLTGAGVAIAGWSGVADISKCKKVLVTDFDVFPQGSVSIVSSRKPDEFTVHKVISYTGSMLIAANCALTPSFVDLMERNGSAMQPIEDFACHEGGGLTGLIHGETVYIGTSGFMNLMGIRLPQSQIAKYNVFASIGGELAACFDIDYKAYTSVQDALVSLLHSRNTSPLFALRDFNVSPNLIKQLFLLPTDNLDFPSIADRYRISAEKENTQIAAILTRDSLNPLAEASVSAKSISRSVRYSAIATVLTSILGYMLIYLLAISGGTEAATVSNILTYMLISMIPVLYFSVGRK